MEGELCPFWGAGAVPGQPFPAAPRSPLALLAVARPEPPPRRSLGDIKGKEEKGYLEERVAKQPLPPDPPQSTANPKLVPGLQPD